MASRSWPADERSGVSLAAQKHASMLIDAGNELHILGSNAAIEQETLNAKKYHIPSSGSGALYALAKVDKNLLQDTIESIHPDLIILEAWQTALTEAAIDIAYKKKIPSLMISHGISIHPYSNTLRNLFRYFAWLPYQWFSLPKRIQKISAITTLDLNVKSPRFYDRDIAKALNIPVFELTNSPVLNPLPRKVRIDRKNQILLVGYFSEVKNQIRALEILNVLPNPITMMFVGKKEGAYYQRCQEYVRQHKLEARAVFYEDHAINLSKEFSESVLVLQTSITEALPITLLEAMASGTPFVATPVGAVGALQGGLSAEGFLNQVSAIKDLLEDQLLWETLSAQGKAVSEQKFTDAIVKNQLWNAVNSTVALAC